MRNGKRGRYTLEFKQEAVRLVESGQTLAAAARSLGVNAGCSFILKRRRLSTVRMMIGEETLRTNHSISWVIAFEPEGRRIVLESSSSTSARPLAMLQRKPFERRFAGGSYVVVLIGG
jgi:transposase-like protein